MKATFPSLYQINTRIMLHELSQQLGRAAMLDDVPDALLDGCAQEGFDWLWFLGLWQTGATSRDISRRHSEWQQELRSLLPDLTDDDISGSPFAIERYALHRDFGPPEGLTSLRERLQGRGMKLLVDFVPNHTAPDHPWVHEHPEYYIAGNDDLLREQPQNYVRMAASAPRVFAYGRDPYFPGWPDTLQLNYRHAGLRRAMTDELLGLADVADGVRCDMAMLVLPDIINWTWGPLSTPSDGSAPVDAPFWPEAIAAVRRKHPGFLFMAEVYWDLEYALQQQGFDYTYDKRYYDRLRAQDAQAARGHLWADPEFQRRSARFLENHDEPRAAEVFPRDVHKAAAVLTFFVPGLRFFHEGQFEGRRRRVSMHVGRRPPEPVDTDISDFYGRLLACLKRDEVRSGEWRLAECRPAWEGNPTWDRFIVFTWRGPEGRKLLVCVNYGPTQGQCCALPGYAEMEGRTVILRDLMGEARYERDGSTLLSRGLYLDMPAWGYHVFDVE